MPGAKRIKERALAEMVARKEDAAAAPVPHRKGKITVKIAQAIGTPALICTQDQLVIGDFESRTLIQPEPLRKLCAIINARIRDQHRSGRHDASRLGSDPGFRCCLQKELNQSDVAVAVLPSAIGASMGEYPLHRIQLSL